MEDKNKVSIVRAVCGTAIFIAHMVTGVNGTAVVLSLALLGIPFELAKKTKEELKEI